MFGNQAICWHQWPSWRESDRLSCGSQDRPWPSHRRTFCGARSHPRKSFLQKLYPQWTEFFLSRLQMLLLHAVIFPLSKSLEASNELNCVEVWMMFLTSRSVFFAFGAAKGCLSANVLCGQPGFWQNNFRVSTNKTACLSWIGRSWISLWYAEWTCQFLFTGLYMKNNLFIFNVVLY